MACGAVAAEFDNSGMRSLIDNSDSRILFKDSTSAVAKGLIDLFPNRERMVRAVRAELESVGALTVEDMWRRFEEILLGRSLSNRDTG